VDAELSGEAGSLPPLVADATERARAAGFPMSCEPEVGQLLAALAAHLPPGARVLELGTGAGVGTAWLASGLLPRMDVVVLTVEASADTAALAARGDWPAFVELRCGDALAELDAEAQAGTGSFDLIFADSPAGKTRGLDRVIAALAPRGLLVVDDMAPLPEWPEQLRASQQRVRAALLGSPVLTSVELAHGSGVILATKTARASG
jgi:demethylmenaquinone methyltransferase/2-methoxy-6-polyprenyl-1,4-benzoquinol methylase